MKRSKKTLAIEKVRKEADLLFYELIQKLAGYKCEICGARSITAHHFILKSQCAELRYAEKNGISIDSKCHCLHHQAGDPSIHFRIVQKRGDKWAEELFKIKRESNNPLKKKVYRGVSFYEEVIEELKNKISSLT